MKRTGLIMIVCGMLAVLSISSLRAQKLVPMTRAALDSIVNPELLEGGENILRFDECVQSIGTLLETDAPTTMYYTFRHVGDKPTAIRVVRTFCRCTSARYDTITIQPGDTGRVALTYRPRNHPGTIDECAYVYTSDSDSKPIARLVLLGEVKEVNEWRHLPYVVGPLRLKRKEAVADISDADRPVVVRIACANAGDVRLRLSAEGLPSYATFHTEPHVLRPKQEGDLVIILQPEAFSRLRPEVFGFRLIGLDAKVDERTLRIRMKKE